MIIKWDGRDYEFDRSAIDVQTAVKIREHTGCGMRSWERAIDDGDPLALQALLWVVKVQNGERTPIKTLNFSIVDFHQALEAAVLEELKQAVEAATAESVEPDPTVTAG